MADSDDIEHYLAEQTQLPVEEVIDIYRAGLPWPIIYKQLNQMVARDAHAAGVTVETAAKALDQLCDMEGAALVALTELAKRATHGKVPSVDLPEVQALLTHPLIRDMMYYSERVALRIGEADPWKVLSVYLGILTYAWEHPDWEPV